MFACGLMGSPAAAFRHSGPVRCICQNHHSPLQMHCTSSMQRPVPGCKGLGVLIPLSRTLHIEFERKRTLYANLLLGGFCSTERPEEFLLRPPLFLCRPRTKHPVVVEQATRSFGLGFRRLCRAKLRWLYRIRAVQQPGSR